MTVHDAVERAAVSISRRDAETLLLHVLGRNRAWLLAHPETPLAASDGDTFIALAARRAQHVPLQYLTGFQEFFGLALQVTPAVLIPRPETELLVEAVLEWTRAQTAKPMEKLSLVDVGTGSGAIALALASALPYSSILALDLSPGALGVARGNATRTGLAGRLRFAQSDLLEGLDAAAEASCLDVVVSNPPYVPEADAPTMQPEVRDHEPHLALFAGQDGLAVYRRLIPQAWRLLRSGGLLAMEFGFGQRDGLAPLLQGWAEVAFRNDYAGIPRVVLATRP